MAAIPAMISLLVFTYFFIPRNIIGIFRYYLSGNQHSWHVLIGAFLHNKLLKDLVENALIPSAKSGAPNCNLTTGLKI